MRKILVNILAIFIRLFIIIYEIFSTIIVLFFSALIIVATVVILAFAVLFFGLLSLIFYFSELPYKMAIYQYEIEAKILSVLKLAQLRADGDDWVEYDKIKKEVHQQLGKNLMCTFLLLVSLYVLVEREIITRKKTFKKCKFKYYFKLINSDYRPRKPKKKRRSERKKQKSNDLVPVNT